MNAIVDKPGQEYVNDYVNAVVVSGDLITAYGHGIDVCWEGLLSGKSAIERHDRFSTDAFQSDHAAMVKGLSYLGDESLASQMLGQLFGSPPDSIPKDSRLILASTKGEIDILEKKLLTGKGDAAMSQFNYLLTKVVEMTGVNDKGMVVSAACASATAAAARAAAMVRSGSCDSVLVVTCDSVTEFVFSGFSSLMALDKIRAKPFDRERNGLSLGEAAAYVLVMSEERALKENRKILGELKGWGLSDDANHMTGPSRDGSGLALAVRKAMMKASAGEDEIGFISAHGTGTVYNDAMELKAFNLIFNGDKRPLYSVKGAIGHTMGAAGLVELIVALKALDEKTVPPTVSMINVDDDANGWASQYERKVNGQKLALLTNAGFSGINGALVIG